MEAFIFTPNLLTHHRLSTPHHLTFHSLHHPPTVQFSLSRNPNFRPKRISSSMASSHLQFSASSSSSSSRLIGQNDLLIVGPGVLGRIIAEQWRQVGCIKLEW